MDVEDELEAESSTHPPKNWANPEHPETRHEMTEPPRLLDSPVDLELVDHEGGAQCPGRVESTLVAGERGHVRQPDGQRRIQAASFPVRVCGREVGEHHHEGQDELHAKVGDAGPLELVLGAVDAVDEGRACDGSSTLGAHVEGGPGRGGGDCRVQCISDQFRVTH